MSSRLRKMLYSLIVTVFVFGSFIVPESVFAQQISSGVNHQKESVNISGNTHVVNTLTMNLSDPYTKVEVGLPNPINSLSTVSGMAKRNTYESHKVVGGVNASFFHWDSRLPAYLLAKDDKIVNLGAVSSSYTDFMYAPAAFGINAKGQGQIDRYNMGITISHHNQTFTLSGLNRSREVNESILFTQSYKFDHTRMNPFGMEVVVTGVNKSVDYDLKFGEKVTGKVSSIRPYGQSTSATIPKDGFVLSAHGEDIDKIRDLKIGDDVSLSLNVNDKWKDSEFMLASGPLLVQNGHAKLSIDPTSPRVTERAPHTAVAVDSTGNRVFFVTVDGRQPGYSTGMNLKEFANYLVSLGANYALNLDGGGSTTMVTRKVGDEFASLTNSPSDGFERSVSAILQAVSTAPQGNPTIMKAHQVKEGLIGLGASADFKIDYILDQYYNRLTIDESKMELSVEGNIGEIENGKFVGTKAGKGYVVVRYGNASTKLPVTVVDEVGRLSVKVNSIRLIPGDRQKLDVNAVSTSGQPLIFDDSKVQWTVEGNIGKVENSVFIAGDKESSGKLIATFGSQSVEVPVRVSPHPEILHSLNNLTNLSTENIRATSKLKTDTVLQEKENGASLKFRYNFSETQSGVAASYINFKDPLKISGKPTKIGMWVYGDGEGHWLRGKVKDASAKEHTIDFTGYGDLNWFGWKYVEAQVPSQIAYPITLSQVYLAEPDDSNKGSGFIYLDKLQAVYSNMKEEAFSSSDNPKIVDDHKKWTVKFNIPMSKTWINNQTIYVEDQMGVRVPVKVTLSDNGKSAEVLAPVAGYVTGKEYRLVVTRYAKSTKNLLMDKDSITPFKIK
ncbi:phosphodiester glycosidase family protein [Bacillus sp. AFS015802]|uniref:phosphodiester glycosidase family protein n=1 Tax=Bacillus sp. AFS015802 TaxID=2033486 RepID=UPI001155356F|nr:phosphodiester glycosidase family protein [Bacillus sp. AFS015802]